MKRARRREIEAEVARLSVDLDPITPHDLRIINLALEDRARFYAGEPAGVAAEQVRAKIARNTHTAMTREAPRAEQNQLPGGSGP